jgi:hypothetical protein
MNYTTFNTFNKAISHEFLVELYGESLGSDTFIKWNLLSSKGFDGFTEFLKNLNYVDYALLFKKLKEIEYPTKVENDNMEIDSIKENKIEDGWETEIIDLMHNYGDETEDIDLNNYDSIDLNNVFE